MILYESWGAATARSCVFVGFGAGAMRASLHAARRASGGFMVQSLCCLQVLEVASKCFSRSTQLTSGSLTSLCTVELKRGCSTLHA